MGKIPRPIHASHLNLLRCSLLPLLSVLTLTFTLYTLSPPQAGLESLSGLLILAYLGLLHSVRMATLGAHYLGEVLWGCNTALMLGGVGAYFGRPLMVGGAVCVVAVDQLCWYVDVIGFVGWGKFPVGVAKYIWKKETTWVHRLTGTHHLWFIPWSLHWLSTHGGLPRGSFWIAVGVTAVIAILARALTPYAVRNENDLVHVWNVNLGYEFYEDVAIPPLHIFDHEAPVLYLPYLIIICNFILNSIPVAVVAWLSRLFANGGSVYDVAFFRAEDWAFPELLW